MTEPTTAAGRALLSHCDSRHLVYATESILAIEAEARAAALDEARAAVKGFAGELLDAEDDNWYPAVLAAIDALREGADKV